MSRTSLTLAAALAVSLAACNPAPEPTLQYGSDVNLPQPKRGLLPQMVIASPDTWGDQLPAVPDGFEVRAIATDLGIPRQTLVLPNGDILVAEGRGGNAPKLKPKDVIAGPIKAAGTTSVKSGNRLTLLRDADGDGEYELKTVFAENLNAPYGLALIGNNLYVANQDAVVRFDYQPGQTQASGEPELLTLLPSDINHHWTKAMTASADGRFLYVGIGSNSNITERGMTAEENRAMVWEIDAATGMHREYATGLRNPTALAIEPTTSQLWAVVNERDEIGPDLVPDYLTSVQDGGFYGWPWAYWDGQVDDRVRPQNPDKVAATITPDYSIGAHVASLGVDFSSPVMGPEFAEGAFVGMHGSWNRSEPVGYKVVFVRFQNGRPVGQPIDFATNFRDDDGTTRGRPVGVTVDPRGAVIIADDLANIIWRVSRVGGPAVTPPPVTTPGDAVPADATAPATDAAPADTAAQ
ncbi:sorbosone dehydrogenase family protein [Luteimonas yindakuii]|uniref:PQQ-dependent sugar dehydrogenase n=1 Tax=Luteimonas yindakuii TaxID=2565782 RepID=UPI0011076F0C|nr:sorbosone dehydrogenase family protein [Luteimonas yindakuii]QCU72774.1 sorbosone dehydrogenase family protein [Luteimonas yindakuii]